MPGAVASPIDSTSNTAAMAAPFFDATDCDFRSSGSAARDRVMLGEAGIGRIVVDAASWPKLAEGGWRGAIRGVVDASVLSEAGDLRRLHERGVRAVRCRIETPADIEALPALADRIISLGWHIEIDAPLTADRAVLAGAEWTLAQMPVALCFARSGGYDPRLPLDHPDVALLLELARIGRAWVKLSDAAHASTQPAGDFKPFVNALLERRGDRIVWGSGIRREQGAAPALPVGLEYVVCDAAERRMILIDNPARLYGFDAGN